MKTHQEFYILARFKPPLDSFNEFINLFSLFATEPSKLDEGKKLFTTFIRVSVMRIQGKIFIIGGANQLLIFESKFPK
jgi:hypothetical protein